MAKKEKEEIAVTAAEALSKLRSPSESEPEKKEKKGIGKQVMGIINTVDRLAPSVEDIFVNYIKPIFDNHEQMKRRLSAVSTVFSVIFFLLYIPFLLFSKIANGLSLGWEIALYVCIGVYAVMILTLFIVSVASGRSTSTEMAKRRKKAMKIVLFVVRLASVAIAITALVITATAREVESTNMALNTVGIIFSVVSILFAALPLIFGGFGGFFKWLISPPKGDRKFSKITLDWYGLIISPEAKKQVKKVNKKYYDAVGKSIDGYILPLLGSRSVKSIAGSDITLFLSRVPEEERELAEAVLWSIFDYAAGLGYVETNPCEELGLTDSIDRAMASAAPEKKSIFRSLFKRDKREE